MAWLMDTLKFAVSIIIHLKYDGNYRDLASMAFKFFDENCSCCC